MRIPTLYPLSRGVGKAAVTRYTRDRDLQRETKSGLNVVENYNGVNDYIRFGKRGELASNRRGLTPIFHTNMTPYGEVQLRTDGRRRCP